MDHHSVPFYPCRVLFLQTMELEGETVDCAHVHWLVRGESTVLGRTGDDKELFLVTQCENILLSDVSKVLDIQHRPVLDVDSWREKGGTDTATPDQRQCGGRDGWWRMRYDILHGRFDYPHSSEYQPEG